MSRTSVQRAEWCLCIYLYSLHARACVKNRSDFSGTWRAYCRRRQQTRMRNRFGATAWRAGPSSGSVAYNHDQCVSRRAQRRIATTVRLLQYIRFIYLNSEHDENVRSPMALGRIPSDPDLRVGHSDVGIPQSRRKDEPLIQHVRETSSRLL